jgi:hypothetical protein
MLFVQANTLILTDLYSSISWLTSWSTTTAGTAMKLQSTTVSSNHSMTSNTTTASVMSTTATTPAFKIVGWATRTWSLSTFEQKILQSRRNTRLGSSNWSPITPVSYSSSTCDLGSRYSSRWPSYRYCQACRHFVLARIWRGCWRFHHW